MFLTIINDCLDDNAKGRQLSRAGSLLAVSPAFIGVHSDLEAGMHLIDVLDATEGRPGLVLVNVAPRGGHTVQWENGTPFGYFRYHDTLIISTVDGHALSGAKQYLDIDSIELFDLDQAAAAMHAAGFISGAAAERLPRSQFRSFDFTPRVGAFLMSGNTVPTSTHSLETMSPLPSAVWHIDNFGNCKTTLTSDSVGGVDMIKTRFGTLPVIKQLRDVADATEAIITGSSGIEHTRFLELVAQRSNFAKNHGVRIGDDVFTEESYFITATT